MILPYPTCLLYTSVGYNDIKSWWLVGAVLTILTFLVHITLGVWWWNMLIGWNML